MRTSITIIALLFVSGLTLAQGTKAPLTKKDSLARARPKYVPDLSNTVTVSFKAPVSLLNSYLFVANNGGPDNVINSKNPSDQVQATIKLYKTAIDSLTIVTFRALIEWDKQSRLKFTADSLKKYK